MCVCVCAVGPTSLSATVSIPMLVATNITFNVVQRISMFARQPLSSYSSASLFEGRVDSRINYVAPTGSYTCDIKTLYDPVNAF